MVNMEKNYAIPRRIEKNNVIAQSAKKNKMFPGKTSPPPPPGLTMDLKPEHFYFPVIYYKIYKYIFLRKTS